MNTNKYMDILHGCIKVVDTKNGYVQPIRFSDSQVLEYEKDTVFKREASSTAGVCIHVKTDASALTFNYTIAPGSSYDIYSFDTYTDGRLYSHLEGLISETEEGKFEISFDGGLKDVLIYFPCFARVQINDVQFNNANTVESVYVNKRLLVMGDSITQGYRCKFPSNTFPAIIARKMGADLLNQGIGGEMFHPEIAKSPCGWNPTHIITCYGTNEWRHKSKSVFIDNGTRFFNNLRNAYPEVPIAAVTPIWRRDKLTAREDDMFPFEEIDSAMERIISEIDNAVLISGKKLVPEISELMQDGFLHPNDLGFILYGERLYNMLPESWKK